MTLKTRQLDANGDYVIGQFYLDQPEAVGQCALTRLRLFTNEWFTDILAGTPWETDVLGKYTQNAYDTILKQRILGTPGLRSLLSYSSTFDGNTRGLTVAMSIDTIFGPVALGATIGLLDSTFILDVSIMS